MAPLAPAPAPGTRWLTGLAWLLVAFVVVGATIAVMLPAAWVTPWLAEISQGRLALQDVDGSFWRGSGRLLVGLSEHDLDTLVLPGRLSWQVRAAPLLSGRLEFSMADAQLLAHPIAVVLSPQRVTVGAGALSLPLPLLRALGAPFNTLDFAGRARCDWSNWIIEGKRVQGHAALQLIDVTSALSAVRPLGSYQIDLDGQAEKVLLAISTTHGPLLVSATGSASAAGFSLAGRMRAEPGSEERLGDLLSVLGRREDGGIAFALGSPN